jgi:hypothetical protein
VDPHTPYVFDGEEFNRGARFFTHGYDIYTPHRVFVLHNYGESQSNPKTTSWWSRVDHEQEAKSNKRLNALLDIPLGGGSTLNETDKLKLRQSKYGLGDRRTLDQLIEFSGIDLRHAKPSLDGKNRCGNIRWVPFIEHSNGVNYVPKFDKDENPLELYEKGSIYHPNSPIAWEHHSTAVPKEHKREGVKGKRTDGSDESADATDYVRPQQLEQPVITSAEQLGKIIEEKRALRASVDGREGPLKASIFATPQAPGFQQLPLAVQGSVIFLVLGIIGSLVVSAVSGDHRRNRKLKKLRSA